MKIRFQALISLLLLGMVTASAKGAVVYTETFLNSAPVSAKNMASVGWYAHVGTTATDQTNATGLGSTSPAVVWTSSGIDSAIGYGFGSLGSNNALYWTMEPGSISTGLLQSVSYYSNNGTTAGFRIAMKHDNGSPLNVSDDFWIVSNQIFDSTSGGNAGTWGTLGALESFTFGTSAGLWRDLNFVSGSSLSVGSAVRTTDLPTGSIVAFGLYAIDGTVRFDNFSINAVPEPGRAVLAFLAASLVVVRRARRSFI